MSDHVPKLKSVNRGSFAGLGSTRFPNSHCELKHRFTPKITRVFCQNCDRPFVFVSQSGVNVITFTGLLLFRFDSRQAINLPSTFSIDVDSKMSLLPFIGYLTAALVGLVSLALYRMRARKLDGLPCPPWTPFFGHFLTGAPFLNFCSRFSFAAEPLSMHVCSWCMYVRMCLCMFVS